MLNTRQEVLSALTLLTCIAACDAEPGEELESELRIQGNTPWTTVSREDTVPDDGDYREVARVRWDGNWNCTATVLGPHAVLTARHCVDETTVGPIEVVWDDAGVVMDVSAVSVNPYLDPNYHPQWWTALNEAQMQQPGGRQTDWPAQHDMTMLFVPDLTAEFLAENQIVPPFVDSRATSTNQRLIGTGSTGGAWRDSVEALFVDATPNSITSSTRDGYITSSGTASGFGTANGGDSGGPTLGSSWVTMGNGIPVESRRHLVGTTQNQVDRAPLADPGIDLTENQELTIRLNAGWVKAAASDPDRDGIPAACDSSPAVTSPYDNECPDALGGPVYVDSRRFPASLLTCDDGYVAQGIRGRQGWRVDQIAVDCIAISCLNNPSQTCSDRYTTDIFGGNGGSSFARTCGDGELLFGFRGRHESGAYLRELEPMCLSFDAALEESYSGYNFLSPVGNNWGALDYGTSAWSYCDRGQVLSGFEVRSHTGTTVTGLQPVCVDVTEYSEYYGGLGGDLLELSCPETQVAVGTVQNEAHDRVGMFGLICADEETVEVAQYPFDGDLLAVHGQYHDGWGSIYPAKAEPYIDLDEAVPDLVTTRCPTGRALYGVLLRGDTMVNQITALDCRLPGGSTPQYVYPLVGPSAGTYHWARCSGTDDFATGLMLHSGWVTDGFALRCED